MSSNSPVWPTSPHDPTAIRLYGVDIKSPNRRTPSIITSFLEVVDGIRLQFTKIKKGVTPGPVRAPTIAVIYAYAFEGHCYKLDKPKIMVFAASASEPAIGCGFETFQDLDTSVNPDPLNPVTPQPVPPDLEGEFRTLWRMWLVDKLDKAIELDVNQGFFEELILEANMPGRRSPTTYSANMQVAHRGGRLTD